MFELQTLSESELPSIEGGADVLSAIGLGVLEGLVYAVAMTYDAIMIVSGNGDAPGVGKYQA